MAAKALSLVAISLFRECALDVETNRQIASIWSSAAGRPLTDEDGAEIARNVTGFFAVLNDWRDQDQVQIAKADGALPT